MHLKRIQVINVRDIPDGVLDFSAGDNCLRRWVLLPQGVDGAAWVKCVALACTGREQAEKVFRMSRPQARDSAQAARLLAELSLHAVQERNAHQIPVKIIGWTWTDSKIQALKRTEDNNAMAVTHQPKRMIHGGGHLFAGYGPSLKAREGPEDFDLHADHRMARFASLFQPPGLLTNPAAFLERLGHKARYRKDGRKHMVLERLKQELSGLFCIRLDAWAAGNPQLQAGLSEMESRMQLVFCVILDITRHVIDASARFADPLRQPGVILLDGTSAWCPSKVFPSVARLLGRLFPNLQFFVRLPKRDRDRFPRELLSQSLPVEVALPAPTAPAPLVLPARSVLLIDVDGRLPNLALMKLSRHFKRQGRPVLLRHGVDTADHADTVFASCVFGTPCSARRLDVLQQRYGKNMVVGGSGVDLKLRLSPEIEAETPDFSLYPELGERAIGFLTRGCPKRCSFCIVPQKEGQPRQVSDLEGLLQKRSQLILLDDNLLAHPRAVALLEEMARLHLAVNFNQTLDLRLLTPEIAALLKRIRCQNVSFTRSNYHFSLNEARGLETLRRRYDLMRFAAQDNVEFVCLYGYNTTLADDLDRFAFLRSLPGAYVFAQQYRPHPHLRPPQPGKFFDKNAEANFDVLTRIVFKQNMKSMEKYYRWLCLEYARQCGRIHRRLLETLYRYNRRQSMGGFEIKLEAICRQRCFQA